MWPAITRSTRCRSSGSTTGITGASSSSTVASASRAAPASATSGPATVARKAFVRAAKRGVDVSIITAGVVSTNLDRVVREASHAHVGRVLAAGAKIHEYRPAFLLGSANLDHRSFQLNNELNVAFLDKGIAARMTWQRHSVRTRRGASPPFRP